MPLFYIIISVIVACIGLGAIYFFIQLFAKKRIAESLRTSLFLIKIPRPGPNDKLNQTDNKDFKSELAHFEQFLAGLSAIKKPFTLEVAVPHIGEEIQFYLAVPRLSSEIALKQVQGVWNAASVETVDDDFNIFNVNGATAGAYLSLANNFALPIRTYVELGLDSFESILGSFAKTNEIGEGDCIAIGRASCAKRAEKAVQNILSF